MATRKPKANDDNTRLIGYARVSTHEQSLDLQLDALRAEGVHADNLHSEHVSAVSARRPKLELALKDARSGDTFVVWKLDRLGRTVFDLLKKVEDMERRGVKFRSITDVIDTSTAAGKAMFGMLAVMAQFERDQIVERTLAGMKAARERGRLPGKPSKLSKTQWAQAERMLAKKTVAEVAAHFKVTTATVYNRFDAAALEKLRDKR
ncbi:recombinase family protein [Hyphomicrobium sp.]|uniref:recombinase family protein n=1 Tax=Hyphomicrobium sp. TaxID=82 RepID=UPI003F71744A